jgi:hypothetical protein
MVFGDVNAHEQGVFHDPSLRMRAPTAQRLFGFDHGTAGGAPSSETVFEDPGALKLPPTFTRASLALDSA